MNIKSLFLGLAVAASLGSTASATELVLNGSLERGDILNSTYVNAYPAGGIPDWDVHGAPSNVGVFNSVYIYDGDLGANLPIYMPPSYYSCTPALGFQTGAAVCANPDGAGHFINFDADPAFPAAISQSISGLVANHQYRLTFSWAAVQRIFETGPIWDNFLDVSLGDQHFLTPKIGTFTNPLPNQGFSGWMPTTVDFTWTGTGGNVLNFLAGGQPTGHPPSINLDGISLNEIPEPPTLALLIAAGFGLVGVAVRRRRQAVVAY